MVLGCAPMTRKHLLLPSVKPTYRLLMPHSQQLSILASLQ